MLTTIKEQLHKNIYDASYHDLKAPGSGLHASTPETVKRIAYLRWFLGWIRLSVDIRRSAARYVNQSK